MIILLRACLYLVLVAAVSVSHAASIPRAGVIGDSISMPGGVTDGVPVWPRLLADGGRLLWGPTPERDDRNLARNALTSACAVDDDLVGHLLKVHARQPLDAVVVLLGNDDFSGFQDQLRAPQLDHASLATACDQLIDRLRRMVRELRSVEPAPQVVLVTLPDWSHTPFLRSLGLGAVRYHELRQLMNTINRRIGDLARSEGVALADVALAFNQLMHDPRPRLAGIPADQVRGGTDAHCLFQPDGIHPGPLGAMLIAQEVLAALQRGGLAIHPFSPDEVARLLGLPPVQTDQKEEAL